MAVVAGGAAGGAGAVTMFQTLARVMTRPGQTLKLRCGSCDHEAAWPRARAFAVLGADCSPHDVRRRVKCGRCGERLLLAVSI